MKLSQLPRRPSLNDLSKRVYGATQAIKELASSSSNKSSFHNRPHGLFHAVRWVASMLVLISLACLLSQSRIKNATFVPGFGFSFFWYALGRLEDAPSKPDHKYYCYSAGCLALSAKFMGKSVDDLFLTATDLQDKWRNGDISRYDVVSVFVDDLLDLKPSPPPTCVADVSTSSDSPSCSESLVPASSPSSFSSSAAAEAPPPPWISSLHVVTTTWFGATRVTRATSLSHLRLLLLQSSFIPFATGNGLYHKGELDGGFSALFHPRCETFIGLPITFDIIANSLNVNMGRDIAWKLFEEGKKKAEEERGKRR